MHVGRYRLRTLASYRYAYRLAPCAIPPIYFDLRAFVLFITLFLLMSPNTSEFLTPSASSGAK